MNKNEIFGRLKDEGMNQVMLNRLEALLGVFNDNIPQFAAATRGQLAAAYNKLAPNAAKGIAKASYDAFDRFVKVYKMGQMEAREVAKATVAAQEAKDAERDALKRELLSRVVEFDAMVNAMGALQTLKMTSCTLERLLDMYDLAKGGAGK